MHNIAEGFDAETNAEFIRFLRYSKRSCTEVQSELYVALDENYISLKELKNPAASCRESSTVRTFNLILYSLAPLNAALRPSSGGFNRAS